MIEIKKATIDDLESIQLLNGKLFEYEYKRWDPDLNLNWPFEEAGTKYYTDIINNHIAYIAFDNDIPVGYLAGNLKAEHAYLKIKVAEIDNMYVEESYRGKNLGTDLINHFKDYCKSIEINTFKVNASAPNEKALQFYNKNGFTQHDITLWCRMQ